MDAQDVSCTEHLDSPDDEQQTGTANAHAYAVGLV